MELVDTTDFFADFPPDSTGTAIIFNTTFLLLLHWYTFYPFMSLVLVSFPRPSFSSYRVCIILYEMFEIIHSTLLYISASVILTFVELQVKVYTPHFGKQG